MKPFLLGVLISIGIVSSAHAQSANPAASSDSMPGFRAIIPAFHNRLGSPKSIPTIRLRSQSFIVFVYRNAVAVRSKAEFVNDGADTAAAEFALPSTGHDRSDEDSGMVSNGILSPRIRVQGLKTEVLPAEDGDGEWYTVTTPIGPGESRMIDAFFWAQTSLTDVDSLPGLDSAVIAPGRRGFLIDIAHAGAWNDVIDSIGVLLVLKGDLKFEPDSFSVSPDNFDRTDTTVAWDFESTEPSADDDIFVDYRPAGPWPNAPNTMARLSAFIVSKVYDELEEFAKQLEEP